MVDEDPRRADGPDLGIDGGGPPSIPAPERGIPVCLPEPRASRAHRREDEVRALGREGELVNNLKARFDGIQRRAHRRLEEQRRRKGEEFRPEEWDFGCFHDFRRTYATEMATHVDLLTLTRWLGHADPKTTQEFYHRVKQETEDAARAALDAVYHFKSDAQLTRNTSRGASPAPAPRKNRPSGYNEAS